MTKQKLAWVVLIAIGFFAAGAVLWGASGPYTIRLTESELQERVNRNLPREFKGVAVERALVALAGDRIALRIEAHGAVLEVPYAVVASANGVPRYDAAQGELFFDADTVRIESFTLRGTPLLGGEDNPDSRRARIEAAAHSVVELGIKAFLAERPVYRFREGLKGMIARAALTKVAIAGDTLVIGVSLWNVTAISIGVLSLLLLALWCVVTLIRRSRGPHRTAS